MPSTNPYASPSSEASDVSAKLPGARTLFASVAAVGLTTFGGCWIGVGSGYVGGKVAPSVYSEYEYAAVPNAMIIGMGQGLAGGCVVGILLVALFYWYRSRMKRKLADEQG
jgi:hypothetical protein